MNDSPDAGRTTPRSRADQTLRDLVEIMRTGTPAQVRHAQTMFYRTVRSQLSAAGVARQLDPHHFNDLFQDTMIAIWDGLPGFRGDASMTTWIHQIFRHKLADLLRSSSHRRVDQFDEGEQDALASEAPAIPVALSQLQVRQFLEGCLETLRKRSRRRAAAIELLRHEYSIDEIGHCLEAPAGTVKRWLMEARQELGACIRRHGASGMEG